MPITVSYDLSDADTNERNYIRSMFERFGWKRLGGSVFRYEGDGYEEDWLNEVIPALMIFRSYILAKDIDLRFFTLDTNSVTHIDFSDPDTPLGIAPEKGDDVTLHEPTNNQSSEKRIRRGIDALIDLFSPPPSPED